jgi:transketolase
MAARIRGLPSRVYCLLGDGEIQEGQVWEAALGAVAQKLDNLVALIDRNHLKSQGVVDEAKPLDPLAEKWAAFGWHALTVDGHDLGEICEALDAAERVKGQPTMIVAETVKGKGIPFMEGQFQFHNADIDEAQLAAALDQLEKERA